MNQDKPQQSREELKKRLKTSILLIDNEIATIETSILDAFESSPLITYGY
jgi:hypothetical protein